MANQMSDPTTPEEKRNPSPRRSPKESSEKCITFEGSVSQTTDPNASVHGFARSAAALKGSSNHQAGSPLRCGPGIQKQGVKRRTVSPSLLSTSPPLPQSSPVSSSPSTQPSRKTSRILFSTRSECSEPVPIPVIEISSNESEPETGYLTAQTTPSPSPAQRKKQTPSKKSRIVRPTSEPRTTSAPTPPTGGSGDCSETKVKRAQDIDGDIEEQLRQPKKLSKRDKELGYVYVVRAYINHRNVIKIGYTTKMAVQTRLDKMLTKHCNIKIPGPEDTGPEYTDVPLFYEQVEKLAHKELANFRYDFECGCKKRHGEYFLVDEEVGDMVVKRWARLCALQPFGKDWVLKDEWKFHLDRFRERNHGRLSKKQHEKKDDHLSRHQRWESFIASKRSDWCLHRAGVLLGKALPHHWQIWSLALAALLVIFTLSWWSSYLFIITAGGICLEERELVVELVSLLFDVAVHYMRPVSANLTSKTS